MSKTAPTVTLRADGREGTIKTGDFLYAVAIRSYDDPNVLIASRHANTGGVLAALNSLGKRGGAMRVIRAHVFHIPSGDLVWSGNPGHLASRLEAVEAAYERTQQELHR